jgi:hypothetical protein
MKTAAGFALGAALALALPARPANGQSPASHYHRNNYELNLHAGALILDDDFAAALGDADDTDLLLGGRFLYNTAPGWGFGANFDWVPAASVDLRGRDEDVDVNLFLYSAEVDYTFPSPNRLHFFVGGGVGAATLSLSDEPEAIEDDSETDVVVPLAAGLKWFSRTTRQSWALRAEIRDNIIWQEAFDADEGDQDPEATHNLELSAGVSLFFGQ